jgi:hypothetical protein
VAGAGFAEGGPLDEAPGGIGLAAFADEAYAELAVVDDDALIGLLRGWRRITSWAQARELAVVTELARRRPADGFPPGEPGQLPAKLDEFVAEEIAPALTLTSHAAQNELGLAVDLAAHPQIAAALECGQLDLAKTLVILAALAPLDPDDAAKVEAAILPLASGLTTGQLRARLARLVLSVDPQAARRRREKAQQHAQVNCWTDPEGTATLAGRFLPPAQVLAADRRLCAIAEAWKKLGAQGGMDMLRAHAYLALLLGLDTNLPPASLMPDSQPPGPAAEDQPQGPASGRQPNRPGGGPESQGTASGGEPDGSASGGEPQGPGSGHDRQGPASGGEPQGPGSGHDRQGPASGGEPQGSGAGFGEYLGQPGHAGGVPAGLRRAAEGPALPPLTGTVHLTIPLATLLGLADRPGEAAGHGPLHADTCRTLADALALHPTTTWAVIITDPHGRAIELAGPAKARQPAKTATPRTTRGSSATNPVTPATASHTARGSPPGNDAGGWTLTLTTQPIAPYP